MLLLQNPMQEKLSDEDVQMTEEDIVTLMLGTRSGYPRRMENFFIPTTSSSSRLHYEIGVNGEVESCKLEFSEAKQQLVESKGELVETKGELAKQRNKLVLIHEAKIQQQNQLKLILARLPASLR